MVKGLEVVEVTELAEADMEAFCWCLTLGSRAGFIVMGVLVEDEPVSSPIAGVVGIDRGDATLLLVVAPLDGSNDADP